MKHAIAHCTYMCNVQNVQYNEEGTILSQATLYMYVVNFVDASISFKILK